MKAELLKAFMSKQGTQVYMAYSIDLDIRF